LDLHPAALGVGFAGEDGEERRLPHAVAADEGDALARQTDGEPLEERPPAGRADRRADHLDDRRRHRAPRTRSRRRPTISFGPWTRNVSPPFDATLSRTRHFP